jgi:hypothetical protein
MLPRLADGEPAADGGEGASGRPVAPVLPMIALDELPIIASVTSRWPLATVAVVPDPAEVVVSEWTVTPDIIATDSLAANATGVYEEETDEMDALEGTGGEKA